MTIPVKFRIVAASYLFALSMGLLALTGGPARASAVLNIGLTDVAKRAELIFEGRVLSKEVRFSSITGQPFTYFNLEVLEIIKGAYSVSTIEIGYLGGGCRRLGTESIGHADAGVG